MIPIIYESSETAFVSNGLGRLRDCISCIVTEERNGIFECDFEYPVEGANYDLIQLGRIVAVTHDDTGDVQPFEIVSFSKPISGIVTFHAVHISYRLTGSTVYGTNINSLADALTLMGTATPTPAFTFTADFASSAYMAAADGTPRSVRQFLGGIEGSILDSYGGEYEWDRWNVILHRARGTVRDFSIRYGVNMLDYKDDTDYQGAFTSCIPFWTGADNDGNEVKVIGNRVDSGAAGYNGQDTCVPLDLTTSFETIPTTADLEAEALAQMQSQQVYLPAQSITVDFIRLQDLPEFEGVAPLLSCGLCDTITVIFPGQASGQFKIVKTTYDVLADRFAGMELGTLSTTLAEALGISNTLDRSTGGGGSSILDAYPVGSIYMSVNATDPGTLFGGTWARIQDTFLLAAGTTYAAASTGGAATVTLTESELPSISGTFNIRATSSGNNMITAASGHFTRTDTSNVTSVTNNSSSRAASTVKFSFGDGDAHENMPPYLAVYVWQRTA